MSGSSNGDIGSDTGIHNPLEALIGYQLRRASSAMMTDLARDLAEIGLRPTEASVLLLIGANPGITQSEVGRVLSIKRANMAPLTASLERLELIRRERVDGRSHGLVTTEGGADLCRRGHAVMHRHDDRILETLPIAWHASFAEMLSGMWE